MARQSDRSNRERHERVQELRRRVRPSHSGQPHLEESLRLDHLEAIQGRQHRLNISRLHGGPRPMGDDTCEVCGHEECECGESCQCDPDDDCGGDVDSDDLIESYQFESYLPQR
jgi:hypothetical protein